eukprot:jgi/Botrbrau1/10574/Bobra.0343s0022.1
MAVILSLDHIDALGRTKASIWSHIHIWSCGPYGHTSMQAHLCGVHSKTTWLGRHQTETHSGCMLNMHIPHTKIQRMRSHAPEFVQHNIF